MTSDKTPASAETLARVTPELREAIAAKADENNKIACAMLRKLAEDHELPYKVAGAAADDMGVRVRDCDLNCF